MIEVIEQSAVDKAKDLIEKYDNSGGITFSADDYIKALRNIALLANDNERLQDEYTKDTVHFYNKWMGAEANCKAYRQVLERIAHPISFMQEEARKEKCNLDGGIAIALSRDPNYLKSIAEEALRGSECISCRYANTGVCSVCYGNDKYEEYERGDE